MAKPLSPKSALIRDAITAHPNKKPKDLADLINSSDARKQDKINVTPGDVSLQKQALKQMKGSAKPKKAATPKAVKAAPAKAPAKSASVVDVVDQVFALADQVGGMAQLRRLVDRLAGPRT
jgi:hypothetical protein